MPASRKHSFAPVVNTGTRVLILGSLPGDASLAAARYYAHPRNQFWRLLAAVCNTDLPALPYETRLQVLLQHGIGLWDVVASAQRRGSLDSAIRGAELNPLPALLATLPALRLVAFNGKTAGKAAPALAAGGVSCLVLPSSSPALTMPFEQKLQHWLPLQAYL